MDPLILKTAGAVIGFVIAGPALYACLKAAAFFGSMKTTVEGLQSTVSDLSKTLTEFTSKITTDLSGHGERLASAETDIDNLKHGDRRATVGGAAYDRRTS